LLSWSGTYVTISSQTVGYYTKIGRLVSVYGQVRTTGGSGTFSAGNTSLGGLPFAGQPAGSSAQGVWFCVGGSTGLSSTATASGPMDGPANGGTAAFLNQTVTGGDVTNFPNGNFSNSSDVTIRFHCVYYA
jgi:hypothetical protein